MQFVPQRSRIEDNDQNRLGRANTRLGDDLYLGGEVTLFQSRFRVRLGPLGRESFREFLPDRVAFRALTDLIRLAVDASLEFDVQLVLRAEAVPGLRIGRPDAASPRLGWSTWLITEPPGAAVEDACFEPRSARVAASQQAA